MSFTKQEKIDALTHTLYLALITKDESQRQELVKSAVKLANKLPNKTVEQCKQFAEIKFLKRDGNLFYANGANAWIH